MIVGLGHQAQVGKDTAAKILEVYGFKRLAFADKLKAVAYDINPLIGWEYDDSTGMTMPVYLSDLVDWHGWEEAKKHPSVRRFLQDLGVAVREHLGRDAWVNPVLSEIRLHPGNSYVITDVRFGNEFSALMEKRAWLLKITRPGVEANAGKHVSETALANAEWDETIVNDGSLEDLEAKLVRALGLI